MQVLERAASSFVETDHSGMSASAVGLEGWDLQGYPLVMSK